MYTGNNIRASLHLDATYLNAYIRNLSNGKQSGISEVKLNYNKKKRPWNKALKNVFIFALTLLDADSPSFLTCAYFSTCGNATSVTDKLIEALIEIYHRIHINSEFLVFDADRHNTSNYI